MTKSSTTIATVIFVKIKWYRLMTTQIYKFILMQINYASFNLEIRTIKPQMKLQCIVVNSAFNWIQSSSNLIRTLNLHILNIS